jgi:hypothetical protein
LTRREPRDAPRRVWLPSREGSGGGPTFGRASLQAAT